MCLSFFAKPLQRAADPGDDDDVEQDYVYTAMDDPRCDAPYMNADAPM